MNKHTATLVVSLAAVVVVSGFGVKFTDDYKHTQAVASAKVAQAEAKAQTIEAHDDAVFQAGVKLDETQCSKDLASYNSLTLAERAKVSAPDCEASIGQ